MLNLNQLRKNINKVDADIIKKLAQRKKLVEKIGNLKVKLNKEIIDNKREEQLIQNHEKLSIKYQISPIFIKKLFKIIINNSRKLQK